MSDYTNENLKKEIDDYKKKNDNYLEYINDLYQKINDLEEEQLEYNTEFYPDFNLEITKVKVEPLENNITDLIPDSEKLKKLKILNKIIMEKYEDLYITLDRLQEQSPTKDMPSDNDTATESEIDEDDYEGHFDFNYVCAKCDKIDSDPKFTECCGLRTNKTKENERIINDYHKYKELCDADKIKKEKARRIRRCKRANILCN